MLTHVTCKVFTSMHCLVKHGCGNEFCFKVYQDQMHRKTVKAAFTTGHSGWLLTYFAVRLVKQPVPRE